MSSTEVINPYSFQEMKEALSEIKQEISESNDEVMTVWSDRIVEICKGIDNVEKIYIHKTF